MPFDVNSPTPDITESIPFSIGGGAADTPSAYPVGFGWDIVIGGLGFRLFNDPQYPYNRLTEQVRKEQFDTSPEAGEQSLGSWWLRSQSSWHAGAGIVWYEPGAEEETANRFANSCGVDPWTIGQLTLLHAMDATASAACHVNTAVVGGVNTAVVTTADGVSLVEEDGSVHQIVTGAGWSAVTQPAVAGTTLWVGHSTGVTRVDLTTGTATDIYATDPARVWWAKSRLIVALGGTLYEAPPRTTAGTWASDSTELYDRDADGWTWTGVAETGGAVLAAGHAGAESAVYRFTLGQDDLGNPEWSAAEQVAVMPPGELIQCIGVYLGSFAVIGTNHGARVGAVNSAGDVQYGPLTIETLTPVVAVTFRDRFAYVAASSSQPDGTSGCARIDLSAEVDGRFPWAWDVSTADDASVRGIATLGASDRVVIAADDAYYVQSATTRVAEGWLETGQIRYRTVEPKAFRLFGLNAQLNGGAVRVTAESPDSVEHRVFTFTPDTGTEVEAQVKIARRPTNTFLAFRLYLRPPDDDPTGSPTVTGYQIKALPAPGRTEMVQLPLMLFDSETDRYGTTWSEENGAFRRFTALKDLERSGAPQRVTDLRTGEAFIASIETVEFIGEAPPDGSDNSFGGRCVVRVRKL